MVAALTVVSSACDSTSGPPPVASLDVPPLATEAEVGSDIAVRVVALDDLGAPLAGAVIRFVPSGGSGVATPAEVTSGADGSVTTTWRLSTSAGTQRLAVQANGVDAALEVIAAPAPAAQMRIIEGEDQAGPVGEVLPALVVLEAADEYGNPTPGADISLAVLTGGGTIDSEGGPTDGAGALALSWTLGETLGSQSLLAQLDGTPASIEVSATGTPGLAQTLVIVSGDGQTGTVASPLPEPLIVRTLDRYGNPTMASPVTFSDGSGGGATQTASVQPDDDGLASASWTLGTTAGPSQITASVPVGAEADFQATALPGPAAGLAKVSGDAQQGPATRALALPIVARVHDEFGNAISGTAVAFTIAAGSGAVAPPQATTTASGEVSAQWTLGPALGSNRLSVSIPTAPGIAAVEYAAEATSLPPALIQKTSGDGQTAEVGTAVTSAPAVRILDSAGNPVPGVAVVFSVSSGGGSVSNATVISDSNGAANVVSWTLGTTPGSNLLVVSVDGVPSVTFSATAIVGDPTSLVKTAGDGQTANVGSPVAVAPTVRVVDAFGNGVPGVAVTYAVTGGAGSVTGSGATTDSNGYAAVGSWTLGPAPGANTLDASATGLPSVTFSATATTTPPGFTAEIQFVGSSTSSQQAIVLSAASRWNAVIAGDLPDFSATLSAGACGVGHGAYNGVVDDLIVFVEITPIDGAGGVLGSAGPCWVRGGSMLPVFGSVRLDAADVDNLESNGRLFDVVLHEMGHVLGVGTLWGAHGYLQGGGGADPYFNGSHAVSEYQAIGGTHPNPVPVENTGGSGTQDSHWRESLMTTELMTGWLSAGSNPLSRVTVGSLDDMGFVVNYGAADGFVTSSAPLGGPQLIQMIEVPMPPPIIAPGS